MEVKELRIENYILLHACIEQILIIDNCGVIGTENQPLCSIEECEPIPLTEEWLLKFGFNWIEQASYCNKKQWTLQVSRKTDDETEINRDGTWFDGIGDYSWMHGSEKPKTMVVNTLCRGNYVCSSVGYVHQLQNLYFALTNEELIMK